MTPRTVHSRINQLKIQSENLHYKSAVSQNKSKINITQPIKIKIKNYIIQNIIITADNPNQSRRSKPTFKIHRYISSLSYLLKSLSLSLIYKFTYSSLWIFHLINTIYSKFDLTKPTHKPIIIKPLHLNLLENPPSPK